MNQGVPIWHTLVQPSKGQVKAGMVIVSFYLVENPYTNEPAGMEKVIIVVIKGKNLFVTLSTFFSNDYGEYPDLNRHDPDGR